MAYDAWEGVIPDRAYYEEALKGKLCRDCWTPLAGSLNYYGHEGGWPVREFHQPQWLYAVCPNRKCEAQWALWKLGIDGRVPLTP